MQYLKIEYVSDATTMSERKTTSAQTIVIISSLILLIVALGLQAGGVMSPSWQVVDIREFRATHHVSSFVF